MRVSINGGFPKWLVFIIENTLKMYDLGILRFRKPPYMCIYIQYIYIYTQYIYIYTHTQIIVGGLPWYPTLQPTFHIPKRADLPQQLSGGSPLAGQHC